MAEVSKMFTKKSVHDFYIVNSFRSTGKIYLY